MGPATRHYFSGLLVNIPDFSIRTDISFVKQQADGEIRGWRWEAKEL